MFFFCTRKRKRLHECCCVQASLYTSIMYERMMFKFVEPVPVM